MLRKSISLILVSMLVFGVLNLIENIIHYNIGRTSINSDSDSDSDTEINIDTNTKMINKKNYFNFPSFIDLLKILFIMVIFAVAQGLITEYIIQD